MIILRIFIAIFFACWSAPIANRLNEWMQVNTDAQLYSILSCILFVGLAIEIFRQAWIKPSWLKLIIYLVLAGLVPALIGY